MYASTQKHPVSYATLFRNCGRLGGVFVIVSWAVLVSKELYYQGAPLPDLYLQAAALGIIFAGYVVGWWRELLGGVLAVLGTIAFYIVCVEILEITVLPETILLAVPGIFYMLAYGAEREHARQFQG
jgi:hypothetical protein